MESEEVFSDSMEFLDPKEVNDSKIKIKDIIPLHKIMVPENSRTAVSHILRVPSQDPNLNFRVYDKRHITYAPDAQTPQQFKNAPKIIYDLKKKKMEAQIPFGALLFVDKHKTGGGFKHDNVTSAYAKIDAMNKGFEGFVLNFQISFF